MVIGALEVRFVIMGAASLKEKRKILKSLKDRLSRMNISVAEVDDQDKWQASTLAFAAVSNDSGYINSMLDKILLIISEHPDVEVIHRHAEIIQI